jgi:hypothetical protein
MHRRLVALGIALCATLFVSLPAAAFAAVPRAPSAAKAADSAAQTLGSATFYGTSAPVSLTAAAAKTAARAAKANAARGLSTHTPRMFTHHASKTVTSRALTAALRPPSPAGRPVVNSIGNATGFNGLSQFDQVNAGTGPYAGAQTPLEPPDQGLCVGNGFVIEPINDALVVYNESGTPLTAVTALNQFFNRAPFLDPNTGAAVGDFLSDPKCYFDPVGQRFIHTMLEVDAPGNFNARPPFNRTHILIAVSQTSDPTGSWNLYSIDTSDDGLNGTPAHTGCPCLPDQPLLGANKDGVFVDVNEFQDNAAGNFNGAQMFAMGRATLESGAANVGFVHLNVGTVPTGDANLPFWGSIQPSTSLDPSGGTELLMTGGPEDQFQNNAVLDNRIAVWSLTGTGSLDSATPSVALRHVVLTSETYGLPINKGATQKAGPTPLRDLLFQLFGENDPLELINGNDSRMSQVADVNGILYGAVNTTVTSATGPPRIGIAYFVVGAVGTPSGVFAAIVNQGYVAVNGENVLFPSIAVNKFGIGAMAFTLSGPGFFPSAAYVRFIAVLPVGSIHVAGPGTAPEDGFSGYSFFTSPAPGGTARWGDYSAAVSADGAIWMGNEFIPNTPRDIFANFGTFITKLPA